MNSSRHADGNSRGGIGILALQGGFHAHGRMLDSLGAAWKPVLGPGDLKGLDGLIIPGGESTVLLKLLENDLKKEIMNFGGNGGVIYGTCAGALLLARMALNPRQPGLGLLDAVMVRNGYGRQIHSFVARRGDGGLEAEDGSVPREMIFIRAPLFEEVGDNVRVLAKLKGEPIYVQEGNILATTFHPELGRDTAVHARFLKMAEMFGVR